MAPGRELLLHQLVHHVAGVVHGLLALGLVRGLPVADLVLLAAVVGLGAAAAGEVGLLGADLALGHNLLLTFIK